MSIDSGKLQIVFCRLLPGMILDTGGRLTVIPDFKRAERAHSPIRTDQKFDHSKPDKVNSYLSIDVGAVLDPQEGSFSKRARETLRRHSWVIDSGGRVNVGHN